METPQHSMDIQGRPEKLRGPGKIVKVGPQGKGGFHSESHFTQAVYVEDQKKRRGHYMLTMTIATPHQPYLLIYKLATLSL